MLFLLYTILLIGTQYCGALTKTSHPQNTYSSRTSADTNNNTNNAFSIVPSHSYQYYSNAHEDYTESTYGAQGTEKSVESSTGYVYAKPKPVKTYSSEISNTKEYSNSYQPAKETYQSPQNVYSDPQQDPVTNNNFYYNYYPSLPPTSTGQYDLAAPDANNPTKYKGSEAHGYSYNYDETLKGPSKHVYNEHDHYHLDPQRPAGRDADSFFPTGPGGFPPPPISGPGPSGPPLPPPPPPVPIKGSIDYILIPLILIGIAGPIFVVLYVILGAFEAKLAPLVRSFSDSAKLNFKKSDLDSIMSLVSRALEKYGY